MVHSNPRIEKIDVTGLEAISKAGKTASMSISASKAPASRSRPQSNAKWTSVELERSRRKSVEEAVRILESDELMRTKVTIR